MVTPVSAQRRPRPFQDLREYLSAVKAMGQLKVVERFGERNTLSFLVIGADGRFSRIAEAVDALVYHEKPTVLAPYSCYWSGLPMNGRFETYVSSHRGFVAVPTNDGLTLTVGGWPMAEFANNKHDLDGNFRRTLETSPAFAERLRHAKQETRLVGIPTPNFFRKPYGPGWVLVGDAGYVKDPITAQGISDAFHDAVRCEFALHEVLRGALAFDDAMAEYTATRDEDVFPMFELTWQIATLEPPPAELQQILAACYGNQPAMDAFVRMNAGSLSPRAFFAPEHIGPIMAGASVRQHPVPDAPVVGH